MEQSDSLANPAQAEVERLPAVDRINWTTSLFLIITLVVSLIATPLYIWRFGIGAIEITLFLFFFVITGMSITMGYHRLFAHRSFRARWPVRLATALFGAATFQMSALRWAADHRYHHKYTDEDGELHDPHNIGRGFFWAHVGWLLVHVTPEREPTNVDDLRRDPIVAWQDRNYLAVAISMGFLLPMAIGSLWSFLATGVWWTGLLGGLLFGGCLRIVLVHHATFLINSLAHTMGRRPYDSTISARDSGLLAFFTFGEGYHNYHHAFQTDYRNGPRAWQFDPAKWAIWACSKLGLASNLRRVPIETIRLAELREKRRRLGRRLAHAPADFREKVTESLASIEESLDEIHLRFRQLLVERARLAAVRRAERGYRMRELKQEIREARRQFREQWKEWRTLHRSALG